MSKPSKSNESVTVTPARGDRRLQVKKNNPRSKSTVIEFEDIDKIQFKVKNTQSKTSKVGSFTYRDIIIVGKLPGESDRELRPIEFRLPKSCISLFGVGTKFGYSIGVFFNMEEDEWAGHKEKLMTMRKNIVEALLQVYDDICADCGMDTEAETDEARRQQINTKLSKIVKPTKAKNGGKVNNKKQYMNLECRYTTFMYQVVVNGQKTRAVDRIDVEDLIDTRVTYNGKAKLNSLRGIASAIGISFIAKDIVVKSVEPLIDEVDVEDDLSDDDDDNVVDVAAQLKEVRATLLNSSTDEKDMLDTIMKTGSLSVNKDVQSDDESDDELIDSPM